MSCILQGRTGVSGPMVHIVIIVVVIIIRYHRYIQPTWRFATIMFPAQTPIFSHLTTTMIKCQSNQRWWAVSNTVLSTSLPGSVAFLEQWNRPSSLLLCTFQGGMYCTVHENSEQFCFILRLPTAAQVKKNPQHVTTHWHSMCFYLHPLCITIITYRQISPGETVRLSASTHGPKSRFQVFNSISLLLVWPWSGNLQRFCVFLFESWLNQ